MKTTNVTELDLSVAHLQVPYQTRPPLSGTQSGRQQEVQRRALREPQVRYAGQHPSVRDKKDKYTVKALPERGDTTTHSGERSRNQGVVRQKGMQPDGTQPSYFLHVRSR